MIFLTKNELEMVDNALSDLGIYPPYELPIEKYSLYLLLGVSRKLQEMKKEMVELEKHFDERLKELEGQILFKTTGPLI